jgi:peptidoglycan/xylan/chitin deacetylase (PgdA/CDA1 family)
MRFVIPAGRTRLTAAAVTGVLVLGWLSALAPTGTRQVSATVSAPPPSTPQGAARPVGKRRPLWPDGPKKAPAVDCRKVKCVALTFDDGPGPYTRTLLDTLAAQHVEVTFFLIGGNIRGREAVVRRELADGHAIGDHTWSHPDLSRLPERAVRSQLSRTLTEISRVTGAPTRLMRPPYGATDRHVGAVARRLKLTQIVWSVDTNDWLDRNSAIVAHRAISRAHRGDIILMHDIHPTTVKAVPKILRGLRKRGFTFVTVPQLLAAHPLKPGKVYFDGG